MELSLILLAAAVIGGLMLSRLTKLLNMPAVTAYLVAGLLLAGEIKPEGKTNARVIDKPREHISIH